MSKSFQEMSFRDKLSQSIVNIQFMQNISSNVADTYFYTYFAARTNIEINNTLPAYAGIGFINNKITLYFNEEKCKDLSKEQLSTLFVHELLHLIQKHIFYKNKKDSFTHMKENIAMDTAINQLVNINDLVTSMNGCTLESFRKMVGNADVQPLQSAIYYKAFLDTDEMEKKLKDKIEYVFDDHGELKDMDELQQQVVAVEVKNAAYKASTVYRGNLSNNLMELIDGLGTSKVNWRSQLRNFGDKAVEFSQKFSRAKINKRFGLAFRGRKKKWEPKFACILDTSGSMSLDNLREGLTEFSAITRVYPDSELYLIECDSEVQEVIKFDRKSIGNLKIKGRGGTMFNPALQKAKELGVDGIVFFTDGGCFDAPQDPKIPLLWCLTDHGEIPTTKFGKIIKMSDK